jgi:aspartate aminotransferase
VLSLNLARNPTDKSFLVLFFKKEHFFFVTTPALAAHLADIPLAATMAAAARARALRDAGHDVIALTLGEPDFDTPPHVVQAAHGAALRGETKYPPLRGTPALIAAVRDKFRRDSLLDYAADEILVGNGARQIIYDALMASLDPGSEVIVPVPYWNAYPLTTRMAAATPVFLPCTAADNFLPQPEAIAAAITPRTRWLVLNFPNNPSGAVCPAPHLAAIAAMLRAHPHVWIMSDDMYEHLVHDGTPNQTMAAVAPDLRDRVLTISGVSKTYAMTGWRVGFCGGPARLIAAMAKVQGQATGGVSGIAQAAAVAALSGPQDIVAEMRDAYAGRSRAVASLLAGIAGVRCVKPAGAFYVFPDFSALLPCRSPAGRSIATDADLADALLTEAYVATVHGGAFGMAGHLRLSTAASPAALETACRRIAAFFAAAR